MRQRFVWTPARLRRAALGIRPPAVLPGLLVIVAGLTLGVLDGGFPLTVWYPAALFLLVLLVLVAVSAPPSAEDRSPLVEAALAAFALFCAWGFLSIAWAVTPGAAWDGANRILLYLVVLGVVCLRPWSAREASAALALAAFGIAAICVGVLLVGVTSADPSRLFVEGRLADPTGYLNANANLWLIGFFAAAHVACSRLLPWPLRALGLGAATLLLQMTLLSQSRGAAIAFVVTAVAWIALTPRRWPSLLSVAVPVGLTALAFDPLVDMRRSATPADLGPALDTAAVAIALTSAVALIVGILGALSGRRVAALVDARPGVRRWGDLALVALAGLAATAVLVSIGNPSNWIDDRWRDFRDSGYTAVESGATRFGGSLGSGRYDYYRVALEEFREHPVRGIGADNFAAEYLQQRRTAEAPQHPHSVVFMVLSQFGTVGAALLSAFLALMLIASVRTRNRATSDEGAVAMAALAAGLAWLVHATGDRLWEFPALGTLGLSILAVAARMRPHAAGGWERGERSWAWPQRPAAGPFGSIAVRALVAVLALAGAISLAVPGVAARYASAAYANSASHPEASMERLARAAGLNRLSADPLMAKGVIAQRLGRYDVAVDAFRRAVERAPDNWFAHLELGVALGRQGDVRGAEPALRTATRLNPRQPLTGEVLRSFRRGEPVAPDYVERRLNEELERRFIPTDAGEATDDPSDAP